MRRARRRPGPGPATPGARSTIVAARREAFVSKGGKVGTEHLLLGILAEGRSTGAKALGQLGITAEPARAWITRALDDLVAARSPDK